MFFLQKFINAIEFYKLLSSDLEAVINVILKAVFQTWNK